MSASAPKVTGHRLTSKRRIVLLATVAGLGAGLLFADFGLAPNSTGSALFAPPYAHAQNAQRPVGFADIVEKVKPAVISVKVKMNAGGDGVDPQRRQSAARHAVRGFLPPLRPARRQRQSALRPAPGRRSAGHPPAASPVLYGPGLGLLHLGRRLRGDQQPRGRQGRACRRHHRRRQDLSPPR